MSLRESYVAGTPSWVDLATSDVEAAKQFYSDLFGWSYHEMPAGDSVYSMATLDGLEVAAIAPQQAEQAAAGVPSHWQMYITVDDIDAAAGRVAAAGGSVHVAPFDVFDAGRMAVFTDPAGAFAMLWQPINSIGARRVNEPGTFTWSELVADPHPDTNSFYATVVGLTAIDMAMPDGSTYTGFTLDGTADTMVAGSMPPPMPGIPAHWSIYFGAADVDASARRVAELGGTVIVAPFDIPVGRMTVCADPQGAAFNLFQIAGVTSST